MPLFRAPWQNTSTLIGSRSISWSKVEGATKYALYRRTYNGTKWGSYEKISSTLKKELDELDPQLKELFLRRMELNRRLGEAKLRNGREVYDPARENRKLQAVSGDLEDEFDIEFDLEEDEQKLSNLRTVGDALCLLNSHMG